ncbi:MAG: [Fe-S]-binding protein, partial [Cytophagaceae bacterium]
RPHLRGSEFQHLSYASSLCGACTSVCPVKIDLHNLLLLNRNQSVREGLSSNAEKIGFKIWKKAMLKRSLMNLTGNGTKNFFLKMLFKSAWGKRRTMPKMAVKSFNQLWKEKNRG